MPSRVIGLLIALTLVIIGISPAALSAAPQQPQQGQGQGNQGLPPRNPHKPGDTPGDGDRGYFLQNTGATVTGVYWEPSFAADAFWNFSAQSPDRDQIYYAPTMLPPGNSCLEAVAVHWRQHGIGNVAIHAFGFWDWCGLGAGGDGSEGWQNYYPAEANFLSKYVIQWTYPAPHYTDKAMQVKIEKSGNCWYGYFKNFQTGAWEQKSQSCGTNPYNQQLGWTMFEVYGATDAPDPRCFKTGQYHRVFTENISFNRGSGYAAITNADHGADIFPYEPYCWTQIINGQWYAWWDTHLPNNWGVWSEPI